MRRSRWLLALLLALTPIVSSCTKGAGCDLCQSDDDCQDADAPRCTAFSDGSLRCGSGVGGTTCRVR
jgi:hypothetical protein